MSKRNENDEDEFLDQQSDFCEKWEEEIADFRAKFPKTKLTDYEIASIFQEDSEEE